MVVFKERGALRKVILLTLAVLSGGNHTGRAEPSSAPRFNQHVRPLLSKYCFACHGPDAASREADLRLDEAASSLASGVVIPGDASGSELMQRILSEDPEFVMPPPEVEDRPDREEQALLARWVDAGAEWEKHWAFVPPTKGRLPEPAGIDQWAENPIDHFILAKLRALGLAPNNVADRAILARRAALDLTGLPPDAEQLDDFLGDTSRDAYARYVERLLASKHAGEHRARFWLDAARYGDTHGMHVDNYREMWPYRDWVIDAFNDNMPFDRFVVAQLAGDLLPEATLEDTIATGFNRCNISTSEGGAIAEEVNVRYMVDRVETSGTVFMGLTVGCAVCHDHKYDPISQREFYELGAFFNNTTQPAMDGNQKDSPPVVAIPPESFADEWRELLAEREQLRQQLDRWPSQAESWWPQAGPLGDHPIAADELVFYRALSEGEQDAVDLPADAQWAEDHPAGRRGIRFGRVGALSFDSTSLRTDDPLTISFWFRTPDEMVKHENDQIFSQMVDVALPEQTPGDAPANEAAGSKKKTGWHITSGTDGALEFNIFDDAGDPVSGKLPDNDALRPKSWQHVCVRYSGGRANASVSISVDGRPIALRNDLQLTNGTHIGVGQLPDVPLRIAGSRPTGGVSDVRIWRRWVSDDEVRLLADEHVLRSLLASRPAWSQLSAADRQRLRRYHDLVVDDKYRALSRALCRSQTRRDFIYAVSTTTLVSQEKETPARAWVLRRGEYDQRLDEVRPGVPAVLPTLPTGDAKNRLGLAHWLVAPDHPLTARVMVNRLWQSIFGVGIVKTSEDFGVMGDPPTHPELLDWLAVEFVESGWDIKHLLALMVNSAAYRQSSQATPEKIRRDPANRYLSRGPRLRLDAEVLRDQALAVSGLLERRLGGPSVRPYQPPGLWKVVAIVGSNTSEFVRDSGDALYRRSLYTFWKRTSPPPSLATFNAPTREQCTVRRERTNTPLQALVLMNDPQFVEAARYLAELGLDNHPSDTSRAAWMLRTVLSRPAPATDVEEVVALAAEFRTIYQNDHDAANELIQVGETRANADLDVVELASWTMVANTIMNRDDFINN